MKITPKHRKILEEIVDFERKWEKNPKQVEICEKMNIEKSNMTTTLQIMRKNGLVDYQRHSPRSLELTKLGLKVLLG